MDLYGGAGQQWWVGVIEDRENDPHKLGRCRVRIFGYHTNDVSKLPKEDLPWAMLMTPATSASISGVGQAPVGPVEGTWVVGFFLDGDDMQQPIIVGTLPGKPKKPDGAIDRQDNQGDIITNNRGEAILDDSSAPRTLGKERNTTDSSTLGKSIDNDLPPLTVADIRTLMEAVSTSDTNIENGLGKYNLTVDALVSAGYMKRAAMTGGPNEVFANPANWVGRDNIRSREDFVASEQVQDRVMFKTVDKFYDKLREDGVIRVSDPKEKVAGYLTAAIRGGVNNATRFDIKDSAGASIAKHYAIGNQALGGDGQPPKPQAPINNQACNLGSNPNNISDDPTRSMNNPGCGARVAFADPNKVYPLQEYTEEEKPDTNKLACGDDTSLVLKNKEKNRIREIQLAQSSEKWDEPKTTYKAKYPFNQVFATEAGHTIEFDNTPGRERIHVWHKSNTYIEVDVNGSMTRKVVGDNFEILDKNDKVYIKGAQHLTVEGVSRVLIKDTQYVQIFGDMETHVHGDVRVNGAKNVQISGTDSVKVQSVGPIQISSDDSVTVDAPRIDLNPGGVDNSFYQPDKKTAANYEPDLLEIPELADEDLEFEEDIPGSSQYQKQREENGDIIDRKPEGVVADAKQNNNTEGVPVDTSEFQEYDEFPDGLRLSKYFTLGAVSTRAAATQYKVKDARGLTKAEIVGNLKALAVNVLDKVKEKYPDMIVTSGYRDSGTSDHGLGYAADLQFTSSKPSDYYEIIRWMRDTLPHKQLLLEYQDKADGRRVTWIHVSYSPGKSSPMRTGTFYNHVVYQRNAFVNLT